MRSGLSQLADKLMIRHADSNVLNIKENKQIMYYAIDENNLKKKFSIVVKMNVGIHCLIK